MEEDSEINDFNNLKPKYPHMVPLKFCLDPESLQIALIFKKNEFSKKKHAFVIELNSLVLEKDPQKIIEKILLRYGNILYPELVSINQLFHLISNLVDFIQKQNEEDDSDKNI